MDHDGGNGPPTGLASKAERPKTLKAITHIHTEHSWDSRLRISSLAKMLVDREYQLALICDHDSYEGSRKLRAALEHTQARIQVPIAAEIRTDRGDVIVVFETERSIPSIADLRRSDRVARIVRDAGGLLWLPHPFRGHSELGDLPHESDVIEVFNTRCSDQQNRAARDLCDKVGAIPAFGADVHLAREVDLLPVDYRPAGNILDTLRAPPACDDPRRTAKSNVMAAEVTNGIKARRPFLAAYFAARYAKHRLLEYGIPQSESST